MANGMVHQAISRLNLDLQEKHEKRGS